MRTGKLRPIVKPDWDNTGKVICDSFNKIVYRDDAQVVEAHSMKFYADRPRVMVVIEEIKE